MPEIRTNRTRLFNRYGEGAEEIKELIGLVATGISFEKWEPLLPFGIRDVAAIIGREPILALADIYNIPEEDIGDVAVRSEILDALFYLRQAVAFFTWLKLIPTLDAQHDENGRSRRLGENEKGLTALQEWKDEQNILRLAYEAVDALIEIMTEAELPFWTESVKFRLRYSLLIRSKEEFDEYYHTGSHRLFVTLLPMLREIQQGSVEPIIGKERMLKLLEGDEQLTGLLGDSARRATVLLTMAKAVRRLPVEVIPEGVVQIQLSQPVASRLKAEKEARNSVATSLEDDGKLALDRLASLVASLDTPEEEKAAVGGPIIHSKGITF